MTRAIVRVIGGAAAHVGQATTSEVVCFVDTQVFRYGVPGMDIPIDTEHRGHAEFTADGVAGVS
jgi:hypothetical protein